MVKLHHGRQVMIAFRVNISGAQAFILAIVYPPLHLWWWVMGRVEFAFPDDPFYQPFLIITVENLKLLRQAGLAPVHA